jgi:hypothetical protein
MLARIMRLDRYDPCIILLNLFLIAISATGTYPSMVVTGWAMPNSSCVLKCSIRGYYIISIKISKFKGVLTCIHQFLMNSSQNLKGIIIVKSVPGWKDLIAASIVIFLAIYLIILKLVQLGFILDISLVAPLCFSSTRKRSIRILQLLSNIHMFPSSKNFLTTPLSKPLIPGSFIFSGPIISRLFSNRGGQKLDARRTCSWSSNIEILLCSPIDTLTRRTRGW